MCIRNDGYPASLEVRKLYQVLPEAQATSLGHLRVIDESGEDYLYPKDYFFLLDLPKPLKDSILTS